MHLTQSESQERVIVTRVSLGVVQEALGMEGVWLRPPAGVVMDAPDVDDDAGAHGDVMAADLQCENYFVMKPCMVIFISLCAYRWQASPAVCLLEEQASYVSLP